MMRRRGSLLLAVTILCCTCAWAQTDTGTPDTSPKPAYTIQDETPPAQPGPKPAFTYPDTTPSLDFLTGSIENSSITLSLGAALSFDSNGFPTTNQSQQRWLYSITPRIQIQEFLPRLSWHASYAGGFQQYNYINGPNANNGNNNLFSQSAAAGFLWQFARHWQLSGNDSFAYSANPFDSYVTIPGAPTANDPNAVFYYPLTNYTTNMGILTLTDQITKTDTLAFTGTTNLRRTSTYNLLTAVPFYNLVSYGGRLGYMHALSPRLSLGGGYDYNSLDFGHGFQRSGIQTITFNVDYLIRPNMSISGWIGPEYTSTKTIVGVPVFGQIFYVTNYNSMWSTAAGFNFGWQSFRDAFSAGFSRQVSDGGGIIATSQVNLFNANYHHRFTSKLSGNLGFHYLNDVSTTTSSRRYNNYFVNVGATYQISKSFQSTASYGYLVQNQSFAFVIGPGSTYNDNRVGVSVNYSWSHPLGR